MELVIAVIAGFIFGIVYTRWRDKRDVAGDLRIDTSDPTDNPYLFLELSKTLQDVRSKRYVTLKVNTINYIPHE